MDSRGLELLESARELVSQSWCQGADARNADCDPVDPWAADAVSWSLLGAIVAVLERQALLGGEIPLEELARALYALTDVIEIDSLAAWNDDPRRTQHDVTRVLRQAASAYDDAWPLLGLSSN